MGGYLSTPRTEKEIHFGENAQFKYGVSAMQGWSRPSRLWGKEIASLRPFPLKMTRPVAF